MITRRELTQHSVYHEQYDSPLLQSILVSPDAHLIDTSYNELYKHDRTTTVVMVTGGNKKFVIKRYNTKNVWHIVRRSVRSTRAAVCWRLAHRFMDIGINTPPPVAMIEKRFGPLRGRSYYIAEHVNGVFFIDYLRDNNDADHIIGGIKRIFSIMRTHRVSHGDMKAANLLVSNKQVVLLDLDAAMEHKTEYGAARAYRRDRSRLLRNWDARSSLHQRLDKEIPNLVE